MAIGLSNVLHASGAVVTWTYDQVRNIKWKLSGLGLTPLAWYSGCRSSIGLQNPAWLSNCWNILWLNYCAAHAARVAVVILTNYSVSLAVITAPSRLIVYEVMSSICVEWQITSDRQTEAIDKMLAFTSCLAMKRGSFACSCSCSCLFTDLIGDPATWKILLAVLAVIVAHLQCRLHMPEPGLDYVSK